MAYPTYSSYRDSGVAWLGEVPSHWGVKRLKFMAKLQNGSDYKHIESHDGYPVIGSGGQFAYATDYLYNGESVLLGRKGTIDKPLYVNGAFWTVDTMYYTEIFQNTCPKFLYYLTLTVDFWKYSTQTALPSMTQTSLNNLIFAAPEYEEQTAIADYLDTQTAQIDALIDKQQNLLAKLAEQRSSVITQAVTRGLNPNAPMKESGVAWLGEVPSHWEIWKITHAINLIGSGTTPKSDNAEYYDGEILWVTTSELRESLISDTKQKISDSAIKDYSALKKYPKNSVAIAMYGATIGRLGILEKEATFNQACCVFGNSDILHYKFLFYWLWQRRPALISLSNGGGQPNLSQDDLKKIKIPLPPLAEQTAIADYLDEQTAHIDGLSQKVEQAIGRLKEYRTALITQAVTGKIKVITEG